MTSLSLGFKAPGRAGSVVAMFSHSNWRRRAILSPSSSFISTYTPEHIFSTSLGGMGSDPGDKHTPQRARVRGVPFTDAFAGEGVGAVR